MAGSSNDGPAMTVKTVTSAPPKDFLSLLDLYRLWLSPPSVIIIMARCWFAASRRAVLTPSQMPSTNAVLSLVALSDDGSLRSRSPWSRVKDTSSLHRFPMLKAEYSSPYF
jgi:hypothetical protein